MPAPQPILDLVARFGEHIDSYKSGSYNETQLRRDFLDPFFKLLGWDIDNTAGYDEAYRDVIHEDQVKVGGAVKAPDYGFRIGGTRKFFLEAKKPSVRIKDDISPAYQLRRYAWSAKLPLSILSDFEEFAVYDTRIKPLPNDPASKARIFYCRFDEYAEKWDFISGTFSREAILKGSFDKFAAANKGKRGTAEVDADFLATIEGWRADLARNLALRNPDLTQRELNFAVQRILDRIIFLRICEDRGIEDYERLKRATEAKAVYPELVKLFQQADDRYNSGLFHFRSEKGRNEEHDTLTPHLVIDDKLLKGIVTSLYYPASPYEFSVLSADILGQVYEQFLGKVITLSTAHRAQVEDKPEVKKAGGVFYTPTYIVDYIVRQTVGARIKEIEDYETKLGSKRIERAEERKHASGFGLGIEVTDDKMPKRTLDKVAQIRVLDPACGSGSFLIGAYQFLLDWHLGWYLRTGVARWAKLKNPPIIQSAKSHWVLSLTERKRILLNNIYGVDIDSQAVEVTKLSLLLKVLEVEGTQAQKTLGLHDRVLPDLADNIKCGNSLIASDFYAQKGLPAMDTESSLRINVFDWDGSDGFPEIMKRGGFDAVIGNPPYGAYFHDEAKAYLVTKYPNQTYQLDSYLIFVEQAITRLIGSGGRFGMIIPNPWLTNLRQDKIRRFVVSQANVDQIVHFKFPVFPKVVVDTEVILLSRPLTADHQVNVLVVPTLGSFLGESDKPIPYQASIPQSKWRSLNGDTINIFVSPVEDELISKIRSQSDDLEKCFDINVGIKPYQTGKGTPPQTSNIVSDRPFDSSHRESNAHRPYLRGKDIARYQIAPLESRYLKYGPWLAEPRPAANFDAPQKLVMRQTGDSLVAAMDDQQYLCLNNMHVLVPKMGVPPVELFLGIINSRLLNWFYHRMNPEVGEALAEVKKTNVAKLL